MNLRTDENSYVVLSTSTVGVVAARVYGEMMSAGVRGPRPMMS